ncbi:hypothetical protein TNCV_4836391 [Trichonephila clavipes]|nr:hypothetical protein TNCV_4836391 [Trichonephila clavipes]
MSRRNQERKEMEWNDTKKKEGRRISLKTGGGGTSRQSSGYGRELVAGMSRVRALVPLKTRRVEALMQDKSIEAISPPVLMVWQFGGEGGCP